MIKTEPKASSNDTDTGAKRALDRIIMTSLAQPGEAGRNAALVGECLAEKHPTLSGRVQISWRDAEGEPHQRWLPVLAEVVVREADRVLMVRPGNWPEPIVVGVIDGLEDQRERPVVPGAVLEIKRDETVTVMSDEGEPFLEISPGRDGPKLKILKRNVDLEVPGRLRMKAESIELQAKRGEVRITASDDVMVKGEIIHLN